MSGFNYESLRIALDKTLRDVDAWRISADQVIFDEEVELGQGGFSTVYAAKLEDRSGAVSDVAVKILRAGVRKKDVIHLAAALARELRVWATLEHPNILHLLGFRLDVQQESAWIISPLMFNGNVRDSFKRSKPDFETRLQAVREMTEALVYLHERDPPVCHGDLKPDNLLINDGGHVVLSDFGLTVIPNTTRSGLTTTRSLKGTVRYLAPELVEDDEPARTLKTDIWAYGCVVGEMLTDEIMKGTPPLPLEHPQLPARLLKWTWNRRAPKRPHIRHCRDIMSNPLPYSLLSKNTGYNDRDLETALYVGKAFSICDNPQWAGWAATSAHRSCRLSPITMKGITGAFTESLIKTFSSRDGLLLGFLYASDHSGFEIVICNTVSQERTSFQQDYDLLGCEALGCSGDLQLFGAVFGKEQDADGNQLPGILRVWHIASKGYASSKVEEKLNMYAYTDGGKPQLTVVDYWRNLKPSLGDSFHLDDSHVAIIEDRRIAGAAYLASPAISEVGLYETEGLRPIGKLKITGLEVQQFVLAGDGKSAILVERYSSRTPSTLFYCDLSAAFLPHSVGENVQCPIRCIAPRIASTSPEPVYRGGYNPDIKISPDGSYAVIAEPCARTVLDLQTGLILCEFWVESGASDSRDTKHPPPCFHIGLDKLSGEHDRENIFCVKYDVDPPCTRDAKECSYHDWNPISFASAEFLPENE